MIFAEIKYDEHCDDFHAPLLKQIKAHFNKVDSGLQSDSWIWVWEGNDRVKIDTFSSMHHQIKSDYKENALVQEVIKVLQKKYTVVVYHEPQLEAHEDE